MTLFENKRFVGHSGTQLSWKVDCDALTRADWHWAAARVIRRMNFRGVHGVPTGGIPLATLLDQFAQPDGDCFLIVDDVFTTGGSMQLAHDLTRDRHPGIMRRGVVLFARRPTPAWISPIWQMW